MKKRDYKDQIVWIIGASSGIGLALARELSRSGAILALSGRREKELETLRAELGNQHKVFVFDIGDEKMTLQTVHKVKKTFNSIDRVIFLAALYEPMNIDILDMTMTKSIIHVNLMGAFNLVHALLPILKAQKGNSQFALCGSAGGYMGLPRGQPYSATKAAIINLAESLYAECDDKIDIKLINPGFVRTQLTDKNGFTMPMIIEPEQAAQEIAQGLLSKRFEIHFPKKLTLGLKILALLPYALSLKLIKRINMP